VTGRNTVNNNVKTVQLTVEFMDNRRSKTAKCRATFYVFCIKTYVAQLEDKIKTSDYRLIGPKQ
jgi:hypothetical protein